MYFDFYFSTNSGLVIDLPFFDLTISAVAVFIFLLAVCLLKLRQAVISHNRSKNVKVSQSSFDSLTDEFDWNK